MNSRRDLALKARSLTQLLANVRSICFLTHRNADPDAIASLLALKHVFERLNASLTLTIYLPEGMSRESKKLLSSLNYVLNTVNDLRHCDLMVVLDSSSYSQIGSYSEAIKTPYVLVDHHEVNELVKEAFVSFHYPEASSTSELVALIAYELGIELPPEIMTLLIAGILYDSRFLKLAKPTAFEALHYLTMKCYDCYVKALNVLSREEIPRSETIAILKGLSRTGLYSVGNYLLAISCVSAYEASVLKHLINAGADIAVVVSRKENSTNIYVRVAQDVIEVLKKPLAGELCKYVSNALGGSGGGHAGAAGALLPADIELENLINLLRKFFEELKLEFRVMEEGRWFERCSE